MSRTRILYGASSSFTGKRIFIKTAVARTGGSCLNIRAPVLRFYATFWSSNQCSDLINRCQCDTSTWNSIACTPMIQSWMRITCSNELFQLAASKPSNKHWIRARNAHNRIIGLPGTKWFQISIVQQQSLSSQCEIYCRIACKAAMWYYSVFGKVIAK